MTATIQQWRDLLEREARSHGCFRRVHVLPEAASTQDEAAALRCEVGDVITTLRQTAGRGRLGRTWQDTGPDGLAMTFVQTPQTSQWLALRAAAAMALAVEPLLDRQAGLKWPNDLFIHGRKAGGVLIEQRDGRALVGIGINVSQHVWPVELQGRAISLLQAGLNIPRIDVAGALLRGLAMAMDMDQEPLQEFFIRRDVLRGAVVTLRCDGRVATGRVLAIRPMDGLQVLTDEGERWFPAAVTTIEHFQLAEPVRTIR